MNENLSHLVRCYEQCLNLINNDSVYDKDAALAMTFILMERIIFIEEERGIISLKLTERCLGHKDMFDTVINQLSDNTSFTYDYCYYPNTMKYLAKYGVLDISTLHFIIEKLNQEIYDSRGSSPMSECMNNIQGKAASARVIEDCLNIIES